MGGWELKMKLKLLKLSTKLKLKLKLKFGNDLCAIKQTLYDTGHLTGARWLLQRALKFKDSHDPSGGRPPLTKISLKNDMYIMNRNLYDTGHTLVGSFNFSFFLILP